MTPLRATTADSGPDLILVLLATFNGARYVRQQLDSIAAQSHQNWKVIVCDDGSNDDTMAIVEKFADRHPGQVEIQDASPVGSARDNFFRLLCSRNDAPYFALCDQDDVWSTRKLEILVRRCKQLEAQHADTPCLVYSDLEVVNEALDVVNSSFMHQVRAHADQITYRTLLVENSIPGCAMLFNAALVKVLRDREIDVTKVVMHDWWIALLASTLGQVSYVATPLVRYRQHDANTLGTVTRSGIAFAMAKLIRGSRSSTLQTYTQAAAFLETYQDLLAPNQRAQIAAFASLSRRRKLVRIHLLIRHQILKQTFARRAYQILRA